eukprot:CAMPEP_0177192156 /NCGR_PEP_ID=MMETSP0367-20130122/21744_1 /TAXON_ID=447022 ORGANISM="Scrippsiella hangoei-like, Strain SHHI-4" /NCGR_SAMPLE_ID=MMETSP0367 /ASSEMBLY_ACC=CAM_ASM_000362 /LENGTH=581 /DNA_ID=CAMNT_0018639927 /DNA_START=70 /DNA_END=1815 /DNA_ORIENTATION=-
MLHRCLVLASVCFAAGAASSSGGEERISVVPVGEGDFAFAIREGAAPSQDSVAHGIFKDTLHTTGWGILDIQTNNAFSDLQQAFAAGMAEGYLTAGHIYSAQDNLYPTVFGKNVTGVRQVSPDIIEFMARQEAWTRVMVSERGDSDDFWAHVGNVMAQFDGLVAGYGAAVKHGRATELDRFAFSMLNALGDLFDIVPAVQRQHRIDWLSLDLAAAERLHATKGHCSGLVKLTGDYSDLFMAHSSWFTYSNTDRIFKHYYLNFTNPATAARRVSFSSYPGFLESLDDFYLLDSGLGWIQTTNTVVDHSVYDEVKPESLLAWQRVRVASAMAHNGPEWYQLLSRHFSGTYANQYIIVDFKLFEPSKPVRKNLLWVVEEMPGLIVGGDKTDTLSRGYWPSYNVPFWPEVYKKSGYPPMAGKHGNYFTYELCPRAMLFRRDHGSVADLESLKTMMRSNNYWKDPYSKDHSGKANPTYAICSRGDLASELPSTDGCYDTKVTSFAHGAVYQRAQAVNGPPHTLEGPQSMLPPFTWEDPRFASEKHAGLPPAYMFDFIDIEPEPLHKFAGKASHVLSDSTDASLIFA